MHHKVDKGVLPILNISDDSIEFLQSAMVARRYAYTRELQPFRLDDFN